MIRWKKKKKESLISRLIQLGYEIPEIKQGRATLLKAAESLTYIAFMLHELKPDIEKIERHAERVKEEIEEVRKSFERSGLIKERKEPEAEES